jgi:hypothetical protein
MKLASSCGITPTSELADARSERGLSLLSAS